MRRCKGGPVRHSRPARFWPWRPALAGCTSESAPYVPAPQPVRAAAVTLSAASDTRSYTGTIKPRYEK
ncbi:MAG: hypothetical protein WDN31_23125 [Hyphomicrobium sp.]